MQKTYDLAGDSDFLLKTSCEKLGGGFLPVTSDNLYLSEVRCFVIIYY